MHEEIEYTIVVTAGCRKLFDSSMIESDGNMLMSNSRASSNVDNRTPVSYYNTRKYYEWSGTRSERYSSKCYISNIFYL